MIIYNVEQGSEEWLRLRLGKITGTRLASVMGGKKAQETLIYELIAEQLTGQGEQLFVNSAMQWGKDHEELAVAEYEKITGAKTTKVGFCVSDEFPFLALSPDRLIKVGRKFKEGVEVKAPSTKTFIKYMAEGGIPDEYKWQVVCYFLVVKEMLRLDFIVYDPRIINDKLKLHIVPVTRHMVANDIKEAEARLTDFHQQWKEMYDKIKGCA